MTNKMNETIKGVYSKILSNNSLDDTGRHVLNYGPLLAQFSKLTIIYKFGEPFTIPEMLFFNGFLILLISWKKFRYDNQEIICINKNIFKTTK